VDEPDDVVCFVCESRIDNNDDGIELFFGIVGRSPQTGLKMLVSDPEKRPDEHETVTIHTTCIMELVADHIMPEQFMEMLDTMAMERAEEMMSDESLERRIGDPDS
jgi:hypothetical protein